MSPCITNLLPRTFTFQNPTINFYLQKLLSITTHTFICATSKIFAVKLPVNFTSGYMVTLTTAKSSGNVAINTAVLKPVSILQNLSRSCIELCCFKTCRDSGKEYMDTLFSSNLGGNTANERVGRVGISKQRTNAQQDLGDGQRRTPIVLGKIIEHYLNYIHST